MPPSFKHGKWDLKTLKNPPQRPLQSTSPNFFSLRSSSAPQSTFPTIITPKFGTQNHYLFAWLLQWLSLMTAQSRLSAQSPHVKFGWLGRSAALRSENLNPIRNLGLRLRSIRKESYLKSVRCFLRLNPPGNWSVSLPILIWFVWDLTLQS